ncbi:unnamed protein product [Heligmosomoides polygyrus]|uniref:Uncharacterized protein n=1 Tax=Heligmosomoides polygyrus TaxID=6339 RepID=A0A183FAM5_HELPZ|nr:unnamed protein product [Heligmosomoides polygyrus]
MPGRIADMDSDVGSGGNPITLRPPLQPSRQAKESPQTWFSVGGRARDDSHQHTQSEQRHASRTCSLRPMLQYRQAKDNHIRLAALHTCAAFAPP